MTLGESTTNRQIAGITLPTPMAAGLLAVEAREAVGVIHDKGTSRDCPKYFRASAWRAATSIASD